MSQQPLSRRQLREIDRRAVEDFGIPSLVLMENAGRGAADLLQILVPHGKFVICCGQGHNGGDGYVIARHLAQHGRDVEVLAAAATAELSRDARTNAEILAKTRAPICQIDDAAEIPPRLAAAAGVVDALLGTGAKGDPRSPLDAWIAAMNAATGLKVAIDVPSGLDSDAGLAGDPCFQADHTLTFVAPKRGFGQGDGPRVVGSVHVLPIGVPAELIDAVAAN